MQAMAEDKKFQIMWEDRQQEIVEEVNIEVSKEYSKIVEGAAKGNFSRAKAILSLYSRWVYGDMLSLFLEGEDAFMSRRADEVLECMTYPVAGSCLGGYNKKYSDSYDLPTGNTKWEQELFALCNLYFSAKEAKEAKEKEKELETV